MVRNPQIQKGKEQHSNVVKGEDEKCANSPNNIIVYGCETWAITEKNKNSLEIHMMGEKNSVENLLKQ